ncbi:hypothetical protein [Ekhidna sp.]|uniref:hypothetical protein n=1 Tax=Ekhidna sp. TaxID=2608089 RepID=UPI0035152A13
MSERDLKCVVYDEDKFTKELICNFIDQTEGISNMKPSDTDQADVVFIDTEFYGSAFKLDKSPNQQVIVISSNPKYLRSFFQKEIADYLQKSEITYARFLKAIEKVTTL